MQDVSTPGEGLRSHLIPASMSAAVVGLALVVASIAYLSLFVSRGWVPHDEGLLALSAEQVLQGMTPHVEYQDAYTGGLSRAYAALFAVSGVELLHVRWLLLGGASGAAFLVYSILRRYLPPLGAALATWVSIGWSFPNYFAGLPSWWLLVCALVCLWAYICYVETNSLRYLAIASVSTGIALALKQTGAYLVLAFSLVLVYEASDGIRPSTIQRWLCRLLGSGAAVISVGLAAAIIGTRLLDAEGLYLFLPIAATGSLLVYRQPNLSTPTATSLSTAAFALVLAALPILALLAPYLTYHRLEMFWEGAVLLPRSRLLYASAAMPSAILAGVASTPVLLFALVSAKDHQRVLTWLWWTLALALPLLALIEFRAYQLIWQAARTLAALLPGVLAWQLFSGRITRHDHRRVIFLVATVLAWVSLNQFPYASPIYFCYTTPLVVVAAVAAGDGAGIRRSSMIPWAVMAVLFALLSMNRSFIGNLGIRHLAVAFDAPLDLPRAHLLVTPRHAETYRALISTIALHIGDGRLVAGPDCPEVYFLAGRSSPTGRMFEFLSDSSGLVADANIDAWLGGAVIVFNHLPEFSPPLADAILGRLREAFPSGERIGRFEVRWR